MSKVKDTESKDKPKNILEEFQEFIVRGNVVELAVGLTVGTAFTAVVKSLVDNLIMPIISVFLSGEAFTQLYIALDGKSYENLAAAEAAAAPVLKYGQLISDCIDFLVIAIVIFMLVKGINTLHRRFRAKEEAMEDKKHAK